MGTLTEATVPAGYTVGVSALQLNLPKALRDQLRKDHLNNDWFGSNSSTESGKVTP